MGKSTIRRDFADLLSLLPAQEIVVAGQGGGAGDDFPEEKPNRRASLWHHDLA
jgi:hypothetical protein